MLQQVWNIQAAEVLAVVGSIHTKAFCWLVSVTCLETPVVAARPTAGPGKLRYAQGETFFCSLADVAESPVLLCGVIRINKGFASYPMVLPSDYTSQGHLRPPGPGQAGG